MTVPGSGGSRFVLSLLAGAGVSGLVYRVLSCRLPSPVVTVADSDADAAGSGVGAADGTAGVDVAGDGSEWTRPHAAPGVSGGDAPTPRDQPTPTPQHVGRRRWWRTNYAGAPVSLFGGPAAVLGTVAGSLGAARPRHAAVIGVVGAVGLYDDLFGTSARRGLRGHLAGLRDGELTTGALKVAGIGLAALAGAALDPDADLRSVRGVLDVAVDAVVIAGTANLVNLLDLRPGRASKAAVVLGLPIAVAGGPIGGALAALAAVSSADLAAETMLGDCGANAAGAAVALALVEVAPRPVVIGWLTVVTGLALASEKVSFSSVIEHVSWLRRLDRAGRPKPRA